MILVDYAVGSGELEAVINKMGVACERANLAYADACFEGQGPQGQVAIGVERKKVQDMLDCIDNGRYTGHQRIGMSRMYARSFLIIEGYWKPDPANGVLQEGHPKADGSLFWSSERRGGAKRVLYKKLRRYLFSVSLSGVVVLFTRDIQQTCYDICELYHYFQKPWQDHKSLLAMHRGYSWQEPTEQMHQLMSIPTLMRKPSLTRRWAAELPHVGVKLSEDAERIFRNPLHLANSDERDWMRIPGLGAKSAQDIVKQILGVKE